MIGEDGGHHFSYMRRHQDQRRGVRRQPGDHCQRRLGRVVDVGAAKGFVDSGDEPTRVPQAPRPARRSDEPLRDRSSRRRSGCQRSPRLRTPSRPARTPWSWRERRIQCARAHRDSSRLQESRFAGHVWPRYEADADLVIEAKVIGYGTSAQEGMKETENAQPRGWSRIRPPMLQRCHAYAPQRFQPADALQQTVRSPGVSARKLIDNERMDADVPCETADAIPASAAASIIVPISSPSSWRMPHVGLSQSPPQVGRGFEKDLTSVAAPFNLLEILAIPLPETNQRRHVARELPGRFR